MSESTHPALKNDNNVICTFYRVFQDIKTFFHFAWVVTGFLITEFTSTLLLIYFLSFICQGQLKKKTIAQKE